MAHPVPASIEETQSLLASGGYIAGRDTATVLFLALKLKRPLFIEGEPGTGKTEIAKVLSATLGRPLIRLQCYEGLDQSSAVYEWNYAAQMTAIRLAEATHSADIGKDIYSERFLIRRPLLQALQPGAAGPCILLIDELDRVDEPFEAFLLEVLSDFQVTIPEIGVIKATEPPIVIITSNSVIPKPCLKTTPWRSLYARTIGTGSAAPPLVKKRRLDSDADAKSGDAIIIWYCVGTQKRTVTRSFSMSDNISSAVHFFRMIAVPPRVRRGNV